MKNFTWMLVTVVVGILLVGSTTFADIPTDGLQIWLRADRGVIEENGIVVRWVDQSGEKNDAVSDSGSAPYLQANTIANQPAVVFDGSATYLCVSHKNELNVENGCSIFVVYEYSKGFRLAQKLDNSNGITEKAWFLAPQNGLAVGGTYYRQGDLYVDSFPQVQCSVYDKKMQEIKLYRDGLLVATINDVRQQVPNKSDLYIGKRNHPSLSEGHLDGFIAEFILHDRALSENERQAIDDYLTAKYGL
ncbi:MAG: LamG domain-containing protein [Limnochordia bacterium]|jgi:hypothetical protein|nr:LamG domain-containing protein [Limnochordia bacterium]